MDTEQIKKDIKKNRPKITDSSINTYVSILKNLYKKYHNKDDEFNINWFENEDEIIKHMKDIKPNIRKTLYSSLIAITDDKHNKKYKKAMMEDAEHYRSENLKQNKTEAQEKNWVSQDDVKKKFDEMLKSTKYIFKKYNNELLTKIRPWVRTQIVELILMTNNQKFSETNFSKLNSPINRITDMYYFISNTININTIFNSLFN
jgi:hypothetical protein